MVVLRGSAERVGNYCQVGVGVGERGVVDAAVAPGAPAAGGVVRAVILEVEAQPNAVGFLHQQVPGALVRFRLK